MKKISRNICIALLIILSLCLLSCKSNDTNKKVFENSVVTTEDVTENVGKAETETEPVIVFIDDDEVAPENVDEQSLEPETTPVDDKGDFYSEPLSDDIKKRITGISYPNTADMKITYDDLSYVHVLYVDYNNNTCEGELICNKKLADDFVDIFKQLYDASYQIAKIQLIDVYGADDDLACADDNTSCFNYRVVAGTNKLSKHSYGGAIDINPMYNPYVKFKDGIPTTLLDVSKPYIDRTQDFPHKIDENDLCYKVFTEHGFKWGGSWNNSKDYQHFEKDVN